MFVPDKNLAFVQIPNSMEPAIVSTLSKHVETPEAAFINSLHPERMCSQLGFLTARKLEFFAYVENTYERLLNLYLRENASNPNKKFYPFGAYLVDVHNGAKPNTVGQLWYISDLNNNDYDNNKFHGVDVKCDALDHVFTDLKEVNKYLSDTLGKRITVKAPKKIPHSQYYTIDLKEMVDEMYKDEIERFGFVLE